MKKLTKKLIIIFVLLLLIAGASSALFYLDGTKAPQSASSKVELEVKQGETATHLLSVMKSKGLIKNELAAKIYVRLNKPDLHANKYELNKNMSLSTLFDIMETGNSKYILRNRLKITEGSTIPTIAKSVAEKLNADKKAVLKKWADKTYLASLSKKYWFIDATALSNKNLMYPLEGYFYPETYYIDEGHENLEDITTMMLDTMNTRLTPYKSQIQSSGMSVHKFLTLTSIVERETLFDRDTANIAGVFMNRLNKGMKLESDITVNYALGRTGVKVTHKMLATDSPYNTYKVIGLPVGPVASVQTKTIDAVLNYAKHDYYYFFAKKDGNVIYSKTYEEHLKAVSENKWY